MPERHLVHSVVVWSHRTGRHGCKLTSTPCWVNTFLVRSIPQANNVHGHRLQKDFVMRLRNPIRALRTGAGGEGSFSPVVSPVGDCIFLLGSVRFHIRSHSAFTRIQTMLKSISILLLVAATTTASYAQPSVDAFSKCLADTHRVKIGRI